MSLRRIWDLFHLAQFPLIYSGLGAYALAIPFFTLLGVGLLVSVVIGPDALHTTPGLVNGLGLLAGAGCLQLFVRWLGRHPREQWNDKAGDWVAVRHSMFFVPIRWWPALWAVLGVTSVVSSVVT